LPSYFFQSLSASLILELDCLKFLPGDVKLLAQLCDVNEGELLLFVQFLDQRWIINVFVDAEPFDPLGIPPE